MVGLPQIVYIGNHGLETWENGELSVNEGLSYFSEFLRGFLEKLRPSIEIQGLLIESKGATASIHYRRVADP